MTVYCRRRDRCVIITVVVGESIGRWRIIYVTTGNEFIIFHFTNYTGRHKRIMFSVWTEQNRELLYCAVPCVSHVIERKPLFAFTASSYPISLEQSSFPCVSPLSHLLSLSHWPSDGPIHVRPLSFCPFPINTRGTRGYKHFFFYITRCTHANGVYAEKKKR